jgi:hypothetical protein
VPQSTVPFIFAAMCALFCAQLQKETRIYVEKWMLMLGLQKWRKVQVARASACGVLSLDALNPLEIEFLQGLTPAG